MKHFFQAHIIGIMLLTLLVSGCSRRMIDFTVISSKNIQLQIPPEAMGARVVGEDTVIVLLGVPLGTPEIKEAVDKAIQSAGPGYDALVDGVLYQTFGFMSAGFRIEGTPIKTSMAKGALSTGGTSSAKQPVLYHSSLGISNEDALANLKSLRAINLSSEPDITQH